ncbi:hypothetical protein Gohar_028391 [Gossypium harknessii]|uniref:Uncharacterized protein n=1 Tax=Gossypium harknessii TaxID=34285 RepID=A0A7J9IE76_9ROSI|nr:hypothetical protein [Gossypium harknessii]
MRRIVIMSFVDALQQQKYGGVEEKTLILEESKGPKSDERRTSVAIYFDAAFDQQLLRSALGLVVRNVGVKYWLPKALKNGEGHYLVWDVPNPVCCAVERKRPRHPD